jgi:glycosyltransferase involved in cell wall biosynthesis
LQSIGGTKEGMTIAEITDIRSIAILDYIQELKKYLSKNFTVDILNWSDIKHSKYDYYHYHYSNSTVKTLLPMLLHPKSQTIVTVHDIVPRNKYWKKYLAPFLIRIVNAKCKCFIVHSLFAKTLLLQTFPFINESKVKVIYFGTLPREIHTDTIRATRQKYSINQSDVVFLHLGYIKRSKGVVDVIDAFRELDHPSSKLILVGKCVDKESESLVSSLNKQNIIYLGFVSDAELVEILSIIDALLNFRTDSVGETSSAVLKSLSFGKPVLASNIGNNSEIIGSAGIFCPPTKTNIKSTLKSFIEDKNLQNTLRQEAVKRRKFFDWDKSAQALGEIILNEK